MTLLPNSSAYHSSAGVSFFNIGMITQPQPKPTAIHLFNITWEPVWLEPLISKETPPQLYTYRHRYKLIECSNNARLLLIPQGYQAPSSSMHLAPTALTEDLRLFLSTHVGQLTTTYYSGFQEPNTLVWLLQVPILINKYPHIYTYNFKLKKNFKNPQWSQVGLRDHSVCVDARPTSSFSVLIWV